jgi:adenylate cyclase
MARGRKVWPYLKAVLIAAAAFAATLVLTNLPPLSLLELKGLDLLFLLRGTRPPPSDIVIVGIDEPSFAEISRQWPWPRSVHARLIDQLKKARAKVIGFDVLFAERSQPDEDGALERAILEAGNVVLVNERAIIDDPLFRHTIRVDPIELSR